MALRLLLPLAGAALVVLVSWDSLLTQLHPTARGALSSLTNRATWRVVRGASLRVLGGRGLSYAGPLAVVTNLLGWVLGMWVGYALVYLPSIEAFSFDPSTQFGDKGLLEALYLSGTALTTVGFGDVVATNDVLRLVTLVEAATGFGVLSAAIAFVLSIYPLITQLRSTGLHFADSGALSPGGAARAAAEMGPSGLGAVLQQLTENHEDIRRFPVLYYFESGNREESLSALLRGSSLLLVALRCAPRDEGAASFVYADALEKAVVRLLDDLERDFVGVRRRDRGAPQSADADDRLVALCRQLRSHDAGPSEPVHVPEELAELLGRAETVLAAVAREHGHDPTPILSAQ